MSMHHSLEVRVPLLDHPLVEFVTALPDSARRRPGLPKALLAEALGAMLPREVIDQPKRTFTFPWRRWLRGPLGLEVAMRLGGITPSLAEVLDREESALGLAKLSDGTHRLGASLESVRAQ